MILIHYTLNEGYGIITLNKKVLFLGIEAGMGKIRRVLVKGKFSLKNWIDLLKVDFNKNQGQILEYLKQT